MTVETELIERWTTEKLIDELFLHLARVSEQVSNDGQTIRVKKYYHRAWELSRRIPVWRPTPEFVVDIVDLSERLLKELQDVTSNEWCDYVLKQAVGRIFENLDFEFYHQSVARLLRIKMS